MEIAKIKVNGTMAWVTHRIPIPAGLVGGYIAVEYADPIWEDLTKTVVFKGIETKDVLSNESIVEIPPEALAGPGKRLLVGFEGANAEKVVVIPTLWADCGTIYPAADPSGDTSTDPSLPVYAQLAEQIDELKEKVENFEPGGSGSNVELDTTLTQSGKAADAKAVGDVLEAKLSADDLQTAVNDALSQAKESGEFNGDPGYTPQKGVDYFTDADKTEIAEQAAGMVKVPDEYILPVGGDELGGVKNGGNVTINKDGTMTAPEAVSSGGIDLGITGATVGQTVKISAVDEKGVPTAWESEEFPSDEHINSLINTALGVIENGTY